ncbi:MAG TPA: TonB-dependent receptor [Bacteroidetes bacterium]|nr:MAG: hypothetical protein A2X66_01900 [Ignavibacteria bacterium GWA2_54_16]HCA80371.1 TonB-dependent receptor [Bacteroidota bacterium]
MRTISALAFLLLIAMTPAPLFGQSALRGTVVDSTTREALVGVNVVVVNTGLGVASNIEGDYRINGIPERSLTVKVTCIGYEPKTRTIDFSRNKTAQWNVELAPTVIVGKEFIVTAQRRGQVAAINQQLTAPTITNIVSEEKIQELPDANAAEAIGRLPGVSLLRSGGEASSVVMRGLSDKFSVVTLDGVRMAPTEANVRGVNLSTVAQGSLAGIELMKALTADKDADAIAGSVNMVTKKAPAERLIRIEPRSGYNALEKSAGQYNVNARYGERFFEGRLGVQVTGNLERTIRSNESTDLNYDMVAIASGNDYEITQLQITYADEIRKRGGGSLLLDYDTPDNGTVRFSTIYNQTSRNYLTSFRTYLQSGGVVYDYRDRETDIGTLNTSLRGENHLFGFQANWNVSFSQSKRNDPFDYELEMTESSTNTSGMRNVPKEYSKGPTEEWIPYAWNNFQASYINQANDRFQNNLDKEYAAALDLSTTYGITDQVTGEVKFGGKYRSKSRNADFHEARSNYYLNAWPEWTKDENGSIVKKNLSGTRFENLQLTAGGLVIFQNFLDAAPPTRNIYNKYALYPLINRDALRLWRQLNINGYLDQGGARAEYLNNFETAGNDYDIKEKVVAGYVMNTLNFGPLVTLVAGVRIESDDNEYESKYTPKPLSGFPFPFGELRDTLVTEKEHLILPNLHAIFRPLDFLTLRLAGYEALARPDFNQRLLKYIARSASGNVLNIGNPALKNADAWNYEVQAQFFGNTIGLFSVSAFYKDVKNMYHTITSVQLAGQAVLDSLGIPWKHPFPDNNTAYNLTFPYNSTRPTRVWGFEVEHQTDFKFLPGFLKNIVFGYNFSFVRSETWSATSRVDTYKDSTFLFGRWIYTTRSKNVLFEKKQKLEDQPEFFGNASLGYDLGGFSFRVSVFHQGSFNSSFSANQRTDGVQNAYTKWDVTLKQSITDHISVTLNLNNITNSVESSSVANRIVTSFGLLENSSNKYGMTADFGLRIEL